MENDKTTTENADLTWTDMFHLARGLAVIWGLVIVYQWVTTPWPEDSYFYSPPAVETTIKSPYGVTVTGASYDPAKLSARLVRCLKRTDKMLVDNTRFRQGCYELYHLDRKEAGLPLDKWVLIFGKGY